MSSLKDANRDETGRAFQLDPTGENELANALRVREETFSSDVLPHDAELIAPSDFYAPIVSGPPRTRPTTKADRAALFPYLAA
ncbi:hypothetical protein [Bradyrhizobium sp. CB2312]|uniref:hypothetical protein n=1 Tax=Bradyrhizobium sp. CB2312 TaxID=3039155 RepID=UPI0024B1F013|nr:hypothetical protein [Bradyrhizobium sp. CB2312]WFU74908.1 hypothetical protein QA642_13100 [Bradyrhizobium sp. CB2312]